MSLRGFTQTVTRLPIQLDAAPTSSTTGYSYLQQVEYDGTSYTNMGTASSPDWREDAASQQDLLASAEFRRTSAAHLVDPIAGSLLEFEPQQPRYERVGVATPVDPTEVSHTVDGAAAIIAVKGAYDGRAWGTLAASDGSNLGTGVYYSDDGASWTLVSGTGSLGRISAIRAMTTGEACVFTTGDGASTNATLRVVAVDGTQRAVKDDLNVDYIALGPWNIIEDADGNLLYGPYRNASEAAADNKVWRLLSGASSWTVALDMSIGETHEAGHVHSVGYHAGEDCVLISTGDDDTTVVYKSSNLGDATPTWTALFTIGDFAVQPYNMWDVGDGDEILCASDLAHGLYYLRVDDTLDVEHVWHPAERRVDGGGRGYYVRGIWTIDGVMYASAYDTRSTADRAAALLASTDGETWVPIIRLSADEEYCTYVYKAGGQLFVQVYGDGPAFSTYSFDAPTVRMLNALCVSPGASSLWEMTEAVDYDRDPDGTGATLADYTTDSIDGSAVRGYHATGGVSIASAVDPLAYTGDKTLRWVFYSRALSGVNDLSMNLQEYDGAAWVIISAPGTSSHKVEGADDDNRWRLHQRRFVYPDEGQKLILWGSFDGTDYTELAGDNDTDVLIDCAMLDEGVSGEYTPYGTDRADESISSVANVQGQWSMLLGVAPVNSHLWHADDGDLYVATLRVSRDTYIMLSFDDGVLSATPVSAGVEGTAVAATAVTWEPRQPMWIAVSHDGSEITVYLACGGSWQTLTAISDAAGQYTHKAIRVTSGDADGGNIMPLRWFAARAQPTMIPSTTVATRRIAQATAI